MSRISKITALDIEEETIHLYAQLNDFGEVAFELNQQGHEVTPAQVRTFILGAAAQAAEEDTDILNNPTPPVLAGLPSVHEIITQFSSGASIFEPLMALDEHYKVLTGVMQAGHVQKVPALLRVIRAQQDTIRLAVSIQDRAATYQKVLAFNKAVLDTIREVENEVGADLQITDKILRKLERRDALRAAIDGSPINRATSIE